MTSIDLRMYLFLPKSPSWTMQGVTKSAGQEMGVICYFRGRSLSSSKAYRITKLIQVAPLFSMASQPSWLPADSPASPSLFVTVVVSQANGERVLFPSVGLIITQRSSVTGNSASARATWRVDSEATGKSTLARD